MDNFKVSRDGVVAELVVGTVDYVDYELRPYWDIRMFLDEVAPGNVHGITAFIWADTGEISSYSNIAYSGVEIPAKFKYTNYMYNHCSINNNSNRWYPTGQKKNTNNFYFFLRLFYAVILNLVHIKTKPDLQL